jgi:3-phosphoglycerate kinase
LSLKPIADYLQKTHNLPVTFVPAILGEQVETAKQNLQPGQILILENLRFDDREKQNNPEFARQLASLADLYINEAFSASHRAHGSTQGVTQFLPSYAGLRLTTEVSNLSHVLENPKRPLVVVLGGAKISDKVEAVQHLALVADVILVGGAVANNFLKAEGLEIYRSYIEDAGSDSQIDYTDFASHLIADHKTEHMLKDGYIPLPKILYPIDVVAAPSLETTDQNQTHIVDLTHDMADQEEDTQLLYLDIGPKTKKLYAEIIAQAGTVFWNGPMGVWENPLFESGTKTIAEAISQNQGHTVVGGGDSLAAIDHFQLTQNFKYVSIAGGAALEFLGGQILPGLQPLIQD